MSAPNSFAKKAGKFMQIDVDYSQPEGEATTQAGPYQGPLAKPVQDLISLICDTRMMNSCRGGGRHWGQAL